MRIIFGLLAVIIVCAWLGFELRRRDRALSNVLLGFAGLFTIALAGAFFDL